MGGGAFLRNSTVRGARHERSASRLHRRLGPGPSFRPECRRGCGSPLGAGHAGPDDARGLDACRVDIVDDSGIVSPVGPDFVDTNVDTNDVDKNENGPIARCNRPIPETGCGDRI